MNVTGMTSPDVVHLLAPLFAEVYTRTLYDKRKALFYAIGINSPCAIERCCQHVTRCWCTPYWPACRARVQVTWTQTASCASCRMLQLQRNSVVWRGTKMPSRRILHQIG